MENRFEGSVATVCQSFNANSVQYLIVGGVAVALHGYQRRYTTPEGILIERLDFDIWYNPTYRNYFNVLKSIKALGYDVAEFENEEAPDPKKSFFRLDFEWYTLELLPSIQIPANFNQAYKSRATFTLEDTEVPVIGYEDLILNKQVHARPKDIEDIEKLQQLRAKKG